MGRQWWFFGYYINLQELPNNKAQRGNRCGKLVLGQEGEAVLVNVYRQKSSMFWCFGSGMYIS